MFIFMVKGWLEVILIESGAIFKAAEYEFAAKKVSMEHITNICLMKIIIKSLTLIRYKIYPQITQISQIKDNCKINSTCAIRNREYIRRLRRLRRLKDNCQRCSPL